LFRIISPTVFAKFKNSVLIGFFCLKICELVTDGAVKVTEFVLLFLFSLEKKSMQIVLHK
jgi:hypothetical protein